MKNLYSFRKIDHLIIAILTVMVVMAFPEYAQSQTLKPFTQRTSTYSPTTKIYKIKGDFTMVGNTSMTLVNYGDETNNSNLMRYVDVDGVAETLNSSSSTLTFSEENGANPNCSNIIYAGLYWTGRADDGGDSPLTVTIPGGTSDYQNGSLIRGYTLTITQTGGNNDLTALYTFTPVAGGDPVVFTFYTTDNGGWSGTLTVKVGAGAAVPVPFAFTTGTLGDNWALATLNTPYTIGTGSTAIQINTLRKARENNTIDDTFYSSITTTGTSLNKLQVKLRHGTDAYQTVTANVNNIFYPSNANGNMYSAYAEVTDYVKGKGLGEYTVADIALREGDGGGTGFFGGWGMIVVYENPLMEDRDVTIFDGHAYVYDELNSDAMTYYELPVSGFNTAREGLITMKYGLIAGEGDRYLNAPTIDNFSVRNHSDDAWVALSHPNNSTDNFFNSSVYTGGNPRNPSILNNTGMDLVMNTVPNDDNEVITNNQTSTTFRYGTNQDTYIIFCIAMSVNAYRPEVEGLNSAIALNSEPVVPPGTIVVPGDVITYEVEVRNLGNEAIENGRMVIPLPFTAIHGLVVNYQNYHLQGAGIPYFDENEGANGSIIWEMGTLPLVEAPDDLLAVLDFSFEVTKDCATLALVVNDDCTLSVDVDGTISGVGAISGNELAGASFITGYDTGVCEDLPIYEPVSLEIDALQYVEDNCGETNLFRDFLFCNYQEQTIPITEFIGEFPAGSRFYDEYPVVVTSTTEYTISNPFPATPGTNTYYALFPGTTTCYYQFTISVVTVTEPPVPVNAEYCVGETATALTATATDPSYSLFFYDAPGGTATSTIIPSTATAGSFTYWVAQGVTGCVGPTATITVTVNPLPELTCPADIEVVNDPGDCSAVVSFEATVGGATTLTYTVDGSPITSPWTFPVGVTTVTVTAENECGPVTCDFTVTVTDNEKPVITTTAESGHLGCNPLVTPPVFSGSDNCGGTITPVVSTSGKQPYDEFCDQYQTWTATFTDAAGNVATEVSVTYIWTEDSKAPVIITEAVSGDLGCNPDVVTPVFTIQNDPANCILSSEIDVDTAGPEADAEGCGWSQSWTASITDDCGNVATPVTITYTWTQDTELPVITLNGDALVTLCVGDDYSDAGATGMDNCSGAMTPTGTGTVDPAVAGTYTITFTLTDACGNPAIPVVRTVNVSAYPELDIKGFTANEEAMPGDLETGYILNLDCSDAEEDFLVQFASGTTSSESLAAQYFGLYLTGSTVSPTDLAAYYTARGVPEPYLSYLIAAANGTKPFAYINGSTVLLVDGAKHEFNPTTDVAMTIPGDYPFGTYTVSGTIVDEQGCETPVTFILKVEGDRTPPEVTITGADPVCPASENVYTATEGMETYLWSVTGATISGTNSAESVTIVAGTTCSSTFELTLMVTAPNGCSGTATKTVTVDVSEDFQMPADTETTVACVDEIVVPEPPVVNDACGAEIIPVASAEPETAGCGESMVYSWTYEDCAGHLHTWTHTINLVDDEYPEITCPNDISVTVATGVTSATVTVVPATADDNCSVQVGGVRSDALALDAPYPVGVTTITWTATDWCGNAVTCTSTVTVKDRPHIAGTVYHDKDRLTDGMVDGTGTDGEGLLYVNLVDSEDLVVASMKVNTDGTFGFQNLADGTYTLQLTVHEGTAGTAMPATALPLNWINTGENQGSGPGSDGSPDGLLQVIVDLDNNAGAANFGIVKEQDVTVSLTATPNIMAGNTNFRLLVKITELNKVDTYGEIEVIIPRDTRWALSSGFLTSMTMLGTTPVNNGDWTFDDTDPNFYVFTTDKVIPAGMFSAFGFDAIFTPGNTSGISTITAQIRSGSGGENRVNNNADSEKIDYFAK